MNFTDGRFEGAEKISGEAIAEAIAKRGGPGKTGHPCHPGCVIRCSNIYHDPEGDGSYSVSRVTFDTTMPNGILVSRDQQTLYVAESGANRVVRVDKEIRVLLNSTFHWKMT